MELEGRAGYCAVLIPGRRIPDYEFQVEFEKETKNFKDAYAFGGLLTEEDERAFLGGVYCEAYKRKWAHHPMAMSGGGEALSISQCGHQCSSGCRVWRWLNLIVGMAEHSLMRKMPMSGIFELFVPGVKAGDAYRYEIKAKGDMLLQKADPYGNRTQSAPLWNSVVADISDFTWNDSSWMAERKKYDDRRQPVSIYETSLGQWESGKELVAFAKEKGYTHVELHPIMEFLEDGSDGYPTSAYFAVSTRYGTPAEFAALVDELHQVGIGVILDWSPAQFPRYAGGLGES
ncbi:MAG: alpha-amylase family glycosyl hydrolase [Ruminococcus sp.]